MAVTDARNLPHVATYWPPAGDDGFGGTKFAAPVTIKCRWEQRSAIYTDSTGERAVAQSVVYLDREVDKRGWLMQGASSAADPRQLAAANQIKDLSITPDLRGQIQVVKAML